MRRQVIVITAILFALGAQPAAARFAFGPGGVFGLMTLPLREMLGHARSLHHRHRHVRETRPAAAEKAADRAAPGTEHTAEANAPSDDPRLNAYDSVLGYALWPADYAADFNRYGYGDIAAAIAGPAAADGNATTGANPDAGKPVPAVCQNAEASTADWLTGRIKQVLHPDGAQLRSFDQLRGRLAMGASSIRISCRAAPASSPTTRLAALAQQLWAVHDAGILARHSLAAFYATLSPDQKARFNSAVKAATPPGACAAHAGASARLIEQVQRAVQPTPAQQAKLDALGKTSAQMEKMLLASCAQPAAKAPLARLDAADQRLVVMNYAATSMEVALNDLYASLDAGQKAKFTSLGR